MTDIFFTIHDNLPREAPGSTSCTLRALANIPNLSGRSRILDVGCGPGAQTVDLAAATGARIVAIDIHEPYLRAAANRVGDAGVADRVSTVRATLRQPPFADASFDGIWAEGAVYIAGFARALSEWRRLLRPRGVVAVTELCWLVDDPPAEPRAFWAAAYPAMTTVAENLKTAEASGYLVLDTFTLPESAWWDDYYGPLERRLALLRAERTSAEDHRAIASTQQQSDLYRAYSASYGYVFFVLRGCD